MMLWLIIIGAVILGVGEILSIAAADTYKRNLTWPDYLVMLGPLVLMVMLVVSFILLPWQIALALTFVVIGLVIWGVGRLLKVPLKKQVL
jgi:hypothetical protein